MTHARDSYAFWLGRTPCSYQIIYLEIHARGGEASTSYSKNKNGNTSKLKVLDPDQEY